MAQSTQAAKRAGPGCPYSQDWVSLDPLRVHYLKAGQRGADVVLLHGGSYDSATLSWARLLADLADRHRVWAPDLPGFGHSDRPQGECSLAFYTQFLDHFLRAIEARPAALVGLSVGGMIAAVFASAHPSRVSALVLIGCAGLQHRIRWRLSAALGARVPFLHRAASRLVGSTRPTLRRFLRLMVHGAERIDDDLIEEIQTAIRAPGAGRAWASFLRSEVTWKGFRRALEDQTEGITVPTLFVHGEHDRLVSADQSRRLHRLVAHSRLEIFEGCGHWVPRERPRELAHLIRDFLSEVGSEA